MNTNINQNTAKHSLNEALQRVTIAFIGAGNMATSIITGLIQQGFPQPSIWASNPSQGKLNTLKAQHPNIQTTSSNLKACQAADVIILAVKPQKMQHACSELTQIDVSKKCFISVAAGVTLDGLHQLLTTNQQASKLAIIRSMPNTPAMIGMGATGLCANQHVKPQHKAIASAIFDAVGTSQWIEQESHMDWVTAISGSGPAHYFLFLEATIQAAMDAGIGEDVARNLAQQTALGAAAMAQAQPNVEISTLRHNVTSPGGTTAAALDSYANNHFSAIISQALQASVERGKELAALASSSSND